MEGCHGRMSRKDVTGECHERISQENVMEGGSLHKARKKRRGYSVLDESSGLMFKYLDLCRK